MKDLTKDIKNTLLNNFRQNSIRSRFLNRLKEGKLTREENPYSHFCVYFAAIDPSQQKLFMGEHIKSGLWLFNGGHIDKNELVKDCLKREIKEEWGLDLNLNKIKPQLITVTNISNSQKVICRRHYDIWYFINVNENKFNPNKQLLNKEFHQYRCVDSKIAKKLTYDVATLIGIKYIEEHKFILN